MSSPAVTLSGTITDVGGNAQAGSVRITLCNYGSAMPKVAGTAVFAPLLITAAANFSGQWSATFYGNDQITPSGTETRTPSRGRAPSCALRMTILDCVGVAFVPKY